MNFIGGKISKSKRRRIHPATGIRRKIGIGFVILGCLLLFAGMISYFELSRLSRTTSELLEDNLLDLEFSRRMLEAVAQQDEAFSARAYAPHSDSMNTDSLLNAGRTNFETAFIEAQALNLHTNKLKRIEEAKIPYSKILAKLSSDPDIDILAWYNHQYKIAYYDLIIPIKDFMIDSQNTIDRNTTKIQNNAYRAIMPGIITLVIAIIIIFVFYILIDLYYIRPVLKVKQGLDNYLNARIPYNVQVEGRDEVKELSDHIATLVTLNRKRESNIQGE